MANTAVIVNEFGEIGIDHMLIRTSEENIVLLDSGCLCCTIQNTLRETLADLWFGRVRGEVPLFDRVLVETTGLAEPGPIMQSITTDPLVTDNYHLDGVIACVDTKNIAHQMERQQEVTGQIAIADCILLTKTDITTLDAIASIETSIENINPAATKLHVVNGEIEPEHVLGVGIRDSENKTLDTAQWLHEEAYINSDRHNHDVNRHGEDIRADCFYIEQPVSWAGLAAWCELMTDAHGNNMLRVKGIINITEAGSPVIVHGVQGNFDRPIRLDTWPYEDRRSRLVIISRGLDRNYVRNTLKVLDLPSGSGRPANFEEVIGNIQSMSNKIENTVSKSGIHNIETGQHQTK
jgi:G3E family GTPase